MADGPDDLFLTCLGRTGSKVHRRTDDVRDSKVGSPAVGEAVVGVQGRMDRVEARLDRGERRLDLVDVPH